MRDLYNRLHELFDYRQGGLYWKVDKGNIRKGTRAGYVLDTGYRQIRIDRRPHRVHRLVFLYHHGYLPNIVDHIDGDRRNNHIENLRDCTGSQNQYNSAIPSNNKSGIKGVSWDKYASKWVVRIGVGGKHRHFGYYDDLELAELVAYEAREHHHKDFARHA